MTFWKKPAPSLTAWLWWLALFLLASGAASAYLFHLRVPEPGALRAARLSIAVASVLAGVCVISATAKSWMRR